MSNDGKIDDMVGRTKEAAGTITGNKDLEHEGRTDQLAGKVKEKLGEAKDWIEEKVDDIRDRGKK